jgi:hypothetical protein
MDEAVNALDRNMSSRQNQITRPGYTSDYVKNKL